MFGEKLRGELGHAEPLLNINVGDPVLGGRVP